MKAKIVVDLAPHLTRLALERNEWLHTKRIADLTGLSWETVKKLKNGDTSRFDGDVLARMCELLGVKDGEPIPFLKVVYENDSVQPGE